MAEDLVLSAFFKSNFHLIWNNNADQVLKCGSDLQAPQAPHVPCYTSGRLLGIAAASSTEGSGSVHKVGPQPVPNLANLMSPILVSHTPILYIIWENADFISYEGHQPI